MYYSYTAQRAIIGGLMACKLTNRNLFANKPSKKPSLLLYSINIRTNGYSWYHLSFHEWCFALIHGLLSAMTGLPGMIYCDFFILRLDCSNFLVITDLRFPVRISPVSKYNNPQSFFQLGYFFCVCMTSLSTV